MKAIVTLALLLATLPAWGVMYKWVDADGKVHYSDQAPQADASGDRQGQDSTTQHRRLSRTARGPHRGRKLPRTRTWIFVNAAWRRRTDAGGGRMLMRRPTRPGNASRPRAELPPTSVTAASPNTAQRRADFYERRRDLGDRGGRSQGADSW